MAGRGNTDLQLLQPVLTLGLLVLGRLCLGLSLLMDKDEVGERAFRAGDGALCRWWVASSGAMLRRGAERRRGSARRNCHYPQSDRTAHKQLVFREPTASAE